MPVLIKRAYEAPKASDGYRVLVDRLWPRGLSKDTLKLDAWMRDISPSTELRKRFHHDLTQWIEFKRRYFRELESQPDLVKELKLKAKAGTVTLIYAGKDTSHNNAVALREHLERR